MDKKLDELIKEVHRLETIFDNCDPSVSLVAILELRAAEERLDLYLREQRKPLPLASEIGTKQRLI